MTSATEYVYTVNIVGFLGESVWGAYTDEREAIKAANIERNTGNALLDAYVEKIPLNRSSGSSTVWKTWEDK